MFRGAGRSCRLGLVALLTVAGAAFLAAAIPGAQAHVRGSASGPLIAIASGTDLDAGVQDIGVVRPDGSGFRNLTKHRAGGYAPEWTSNGRWLVFWPGWRIGLNGAGRIRLPGNFEYGDSASADGRFVAVGPVIRDAHGRFVRNLERRLGRYPVVQDSVWSRDGRYLAVTATRSWDSEVGRTLIVRTDGKFPALPLRPGPCDAGEPVSFSPDGSRLLTASSEPEYGVACVTSVRTGVRRRLQGRIARSSAIAWSPDGRHLAYLGPRGGLYVSGASGRRERLLTAAPRGSGIAWSPRADRIALCDEDGLRLISVASKRSVLLTRRCQAEAPSWEPKGRALTFSSGDEIFTVSASTGRLRRVVSAALYADWPVWAPDRSRLAFARGPHGMHEESTFGVYVVRPNGAGLRRLGRGYAPEWAPDSRHLVYVDPAGTKDPRGKYAAGRIVVVELDGKSTRIATGTAPAWSPDGKAIAFMRYSFSSRSGDVFAKGAVVGSTLSVVGADGTGERVLMRSAKWGDAQFWPRWAPDGSAIAVDERLFDETSEESPLPHRVTLIDPVSGAARPLAALSASFEESPGSLRWSPDSRRLLVREPERISALDVATSASTTLADKPGHDWKFTCPVWSPDGKRVAYLRSNEVSDSGPFSDVWTMKSDGSGRHRVMRTAAVEQWLAWAPTLRPLRTPMSNGGSRGS